MKERAERESFHFSEKEKNIWSTQIEGKNSNRKGTEIKERTAAFIAGPYSPYDTVFNNVTRFGIGNESVRQKSKEF